MSEEPSVTKTGKTCKDGCCPLQTPGGMALYLIGLSVGILAPWPYSLIGLVILIALFCKARM
ncbi:MAG: hypothetical protein V1875_02930 [Candidatus Altiarchaeota archaeon]